MTSQAFKQRSSRLDYFRLIVVSRVVGTWGPHWDVVISFAKPCRFNSMIAALKIWFDLENSPSHIVDSSQEMSLKKKFSPHSQSNKYTEHISQKFIQFLLRNFSSISVLIFWLNFVPVCQECNNYCMVFLVAFLVFSEFLPSIKFCISSSDNLGKHFLLASRGFIIDHGWLKRSENW